MDLASGGPDSPVVEPGTTGPIRSGGRWQWIVERLTLLGSIRDGILVGGAVFYAAGYLVWSSHAWLNNMGMLPALDFQYFAAGCIPVVIVALAYWAGRSLWNFIMKVWPKKVHADATGGWKIVRLVLRCLFVCDVTHTLCVNEKSWQSQRALRDPHAARVTYVEAQWNWMCNCAPA